MSFVRRFAFPLSAVAMSLLLAGSATAATVSSPAKVIPRAAVPSDCSYELLFPATLFMQCSGRPAQQQWRAGADCYDHTTGGYVFKYGRIATGDDYSAITGCLPWKNVGFFVVS